jgi:hypothetical protein
MQYNDLHQYLRKNVDDLISILDKVLVDYNEMIQTDSPPQLLKLEAGLVLKA